MSAQKEPIKPKRGRRMAASSYNAMLRNCNRAMIKSQTERMECECGKILFKSQYQNHLTTKMHEQLLKYKKLAEEGTNLLEHKQPSQSKKDIARNEPVDELLLKMMTDTEYRNKVKGYLEILENQS